MPSRKIVLAGAGALALVVLLVVLVTGRDDASPRIVRGAGTAFPLRGSLAGDRDAIDGALKAWKDRRGGPARAAAARFVEDERVHLLYAGRIDERSVVIVSQGGRLIAMHQPFDRGWFVGDSNDRFDAFDSLPAAIDGAVLLPEGDWTYLPLRSRATQPQTADGLISTGSAYGGDVEPGFVVSDTEPRRDRLSTVYDMVAGSFRVDGGTLRRIVDASRHAGRLTAIHAGLLGDEDEQIPTSRFRTFDVLWTGRLAGVPEAAVVALDFPRRLGLGLVRDPDGFVSSAQTVSLGARVGPTGRERPGAVGASYVGDEEPRTLVVAATAPVDRVEILAGTRRLTRPGPVAVVPVDWDTATTDAVVLGRTADGAAIAPLVPESP